MGCSRTPVPARLSASFYITRCEWLGIFIMHASPSGEKVLVARLGCSCLFLVSYSLYLTGPFTTAQHSSGYDSLAERAPRGENHVLATVVLAGMSESGWLAEITYKCIVSVLMSYLYSTSGLSVLTIAGMVGDCSTSPRFLEQTAQAVHTTAEIFGAARALFSLSVVFTARGYGGASR